MGEKKLRTSNHILDSALELFLTNSIFKTTIRDIALKANVGEATVYRAFGSKENIILEASMKLSKDLLENRFKFDSKLSGHKQISEFFMNYVNIYKEEPRYYIFLGELDYFIQENKDVNIRSYEGYILKYRELFEMMYNKGIFDGSIRKIDDLNSYYYTATLTLISFAKKLSQGAILEQDTRMDGVKQLTLLVKMLLNYIRG